MGGGWGLRGHAPQGKFDSLRSLLSSETIFGPFFSLVWACIQCQWKGKNIVFPCILEEAEKKLFAQCVFGRDFPSPRRTIVSGIENYPSTCMSCCFDDLALLLDLLKLGSENISSREQIFATTARSLKNGRTTLNHNNLK